MKNTEIWELFKKLTAFYNTDKTVHCFLIWSSETVLCLKLLIQQEANTTNLQCFLKIITFCWSYKNFYRYKNSLNLKQKSYTVSWTGSITWLCAVESIPQDKVSTHVLWSTLLYGYMLVCLIRTELKKKDVSESNSK